MVRTIEEAGVKYCPFNTALYCNPKSCMAWEYDITDELDEELTNKYAAKEEIETGLYSNPIFKRSTTKGWCKLIDKEY